MRHCTERFTTIGRCPTTPRFSNKVQPDYPVRARDAKLAGTVRAVIVVDAEGRVRDAEVVEGLGMGLDEAAIEAVRKWRFSPGCKDGRAVNVRMFIGVDFRIQ
jgi:protein TonB